MTAHLAERRVLLVLDNCEHLSAGRTSRRSAAHSCERVRILATSREPSESRERPSLAGAAARRRPTRGTLGAGGGWPLRGAEAASPTRAVAARPASRSPTSNAGGIAEICRRLDGLPLAIELAAVRLASMSADDLRERLDDRLRPAGDGSRHRAGPRSQTLRATVDWSYELLSDEERMLWRRLSVFAGSFGLEAAEDVCSGTGLERERIVELVGSLVGKSILTMVRGGRRGRYRLLETMPALRRAALGRGR